MYVKQMVTLIKEAEGLDTWKQHHQPSCKCDYQGSAPNMESTGALRIVERSVEKHDLRYVNYYGLKVVDWEKTNWAIWF